MKSKIKPTSILTPNMIKKNTTLLQIFHLTSMLNVLYPNVTHNFHILQDVNHTENNEKLYNNTAIFLPVHLRKGELVYHFGIKEKTKPMKS